MMLHYLDDMDSKMECMRALIESDRQVEGCFTAYNTAMERSVLKKDLFLNPPAVSKEPASKEPVSKEPSSPPHAPTETAPKAPAAAPPAAAVSNGTPKSDSAFADKLKLALQPASSSEGK
jgi:hypothetical protein